MSKTVLDSCVWGSSLSMWLQCFRSHSRCGESIPLKPGRFEEGKEELQG